MLKVKDFYNALDRIAPFKLAESWDNVGLIVGSMDDSVQNVMLALDVTEKVISEAVENKANLIITHHPLMFAGIKRLSSNDLVYKLAANRIALISAHTNLDAVQGGINDVLAEMLELKSIKPLEVVSSEPYYQISVYVPKNSAEFVYNAMSEAGAGRYGNYSACAFVSDGEGSFLPESGAEPAIGSVGNLENVAEVKIEMLVSPQVLNNVVTEMIKAHPYEQPSYNTVKNYSQNEINALGRVGDLTNDLSAKELALLIKEKLGLEAVRFSDNGKSIKRVALCSGAGGGMIDSVIASDADAFFTGELKHSDILMLNDVGISVVEAGHFASENVIMKPLNKRLNEEIGNANVLISQSCTDGIMTI